MINKLKFGICVLLLCAMACKNNSDQPVVSDKNEVQRKSNLTAVVKQIDPLKIKISDLANNPKEYSGKLIQMSGECTKINEAIMGRNWIHLKDGSKDDFDLVITSNDVVPVGKSVTMNGVVTLDKDFGSGYKYDIIVEEGVVVQ